MQSYVYVLQSTLPKGTTQNAMTWWSPTRIEPHVVSSRHIYFVEDIYCMHANLGYVYFNVKGSSYVLINIVHAAKIEIREYVKWSLTTG